MGTFSGKTVVITGASRGIGKAIGLKLAAAGANIVVAAKSVTEDPKLGGTIHSAADEMKAAGGNAIAVQCDIRDEEQIDNVVRQAEAAFGGIDALINNASAITLTNVQKTEAKRLDLMLDINIRGTLLMSKACIPLLFKSSNGHILTLSPPVNLEAKWLGGHAGYTVSKYGMTMIALGLAEELCKQGVASNTLWPKTTIDTAAVRNLLGGEQLAKMSRKPAIIAEAAFTVLQKSAAENTGNTYIDEDLLREEGVNDFDSYAVNPGGKLYPDLFL